MEGESLSVVMRTLHPHCSDVQRCIRDNTFPLESSVTHHDGRNSSLWSSNMGLVYMGVCHTFSYPEDPDTDRSLFAFYLEPGLKYRILIHDLKFYLHVGKSGIFPRMFVLYNSDQEMKPGFYDHYEMTVNQHHLLNRPEQPCEKKEDYDFLGCVKTSQAKSVGCRPPWDIWSPDTIPLCHTMDQLQEYENLESSFYQLERILALTGCRVPCIYKVSELAIKTKTFHDITLTFPRNTKKLKILSVVR